MIGTLNSKVCGVCAILGGCFALGVVCADEIQMAGGESLSGEIVSIRADGVVELSSLNSPERILLKAGTLEKVVFGPPENPRGGAGAMLELINGDRLPVRLLGINEEAMTVDTACAGKLIVPRKVARALQFGGGSSKPIYSGPRSPSDWLAGVDADEAWRFEDVSLVADGPAYASRKLELPENFSVSFTVGWQLNPSLVVTLADGLLGKGKEVDRYLVYFSSSGFEIKRESTKGSRYTNVILSNRTPDDFADQEIDVQIKVDRRSSRLQLWIDGELEASGIDPIEIAPAGVGVSFRSQTQKNQELTLKKISVNSFDDAPRRHLSEKRGDKGLDSLISRDDDRWGGRLLGARKEAGEVVFLFKSDFQDAPLELAESEISTLFFADVSGAESRRAAHRYKVLLQGEGHLQLDSCAFSEGHVIAEHPLLGELKLSRATLTALERANLNSSSEPEK